MHEHTQNTMQCVITPGCDLGRILEALDSYSITQPIPNDLRNMLELALQYNSPSLLHEAMRSVERLTKDGIRARILGLNL